MNSVELKWFPNLPPTLLPQCETIFLGLFRRKIGNKIELVIGPVFYKRSEGRYIFSKTMDEYIGRSSQILYWAIPEIPESIIEDEQLMNLIPGAYESTDPLYDSPFQRMKRKGEILSIVRGRNRNDSR
jgi:hypothetical protein